MNVPEGRKMEYSIWRACERFGYDPETFDDFPREKQKQLIAYNQIREHEEVDQQNKMMANLIKAMTPKVKS